MVRLEIQSCLDVTEKLLVTLNGQQGDKERTETIEEVNRLLTLRQELLPSLQPPFTAEEKEIGQKIVKMNQSIDTNLSEWKLSIQRDINGFSKKKTSITKYADPYRNVQFDGMFYDKKK
ncbi:flagellar protein FliT [Mangrovibacillus cuniculi]|uniref:Flagellar protein FliT n=1 Tax=Mangrovibacillus cuniculi TaxID=2593652 RepID=A0A7S8CCU5_9BACI|nr:flagellar protein FliT [Mangrovibacillus cuniculi]QPC47501.1 flagellar protein FliT [Mangrovibacillus cuniculi]